MRKIKTSKKLAVSAFALAASATLLFPGNVFAAAAAKENVNQVGGAYVVYTDNTKKTVDVDVDGAYCVQTENDADAVGDNYANVLYFVDGKQSISYTGLAKYEDATNKLLYFNNGKVDASKTGIVEFEGKQYYVKNGVVAKTPVVADGIVLADPSKTYEKTTVYYVKDDVVTAKTGLVYMGATVTSEAASVANTDAVKHIFYFKDGVMDKETEGFVRDGQKLFYVKKGEVVTGATAKYDFAVRPYGGKYVLTVQEQVGTGDKFTVAATTSTVYGSGVAAYTGIARNPNNGTYWYVKNNYVDFNYSDIAKAVTGDALVTDTTTTGIGNNDLVKFTNGQYIKNYTGFAFYNGGTTNTTTDDVTYFMVNGKVGVAADYNTNTGISYKGSVRSLGDKKNTWAYVTEGSGAATGKLVAADKDDANANNVVGINPNNGTKWAVRNGVVDFSYTGVIEDEDGNPVMAVNGQVDEKYTGFGTYKSGSGLAETVTYIYFEDGEKAEDVTGVRPFGDDKNTWVFVEDGVANFSVTGIQENPKNETLWLVKGGIVDFSYTGSYTSLADEKTVYEVVNGQVLSSTTTAK